MLTHLGFCTYRASSTAGWARQPPGTLRPPSPLPSLLFPSPPTLYPSLSPNRQCGTKSRRTTHPHPTPPTSPVPSPTATNPHWPCRWRLSVRTACSQPLSPTSPPPTALTQTTQTISAPRLATTPHAPVLPFPSLHWTPPSITHSCGPHATTVTLGPMPSFTAWPH